MIDTSGAGDVSPRVPILRVVEITTGGLRPPLSGSLF